MSNSNGNVSIEIVSSDNLEFELEEITLNQLDSREYMDLGAITYFSINSNQGSVEEIIVNVFDNDDYVYSKTIQIITGENEILYADVKKIKKKLNWKAKTNLFKGIKKTINSYK